MSCWNSCGRSEPPGCRQDGHHRRFQGRLVCGFLFVGCCGRLRGRSAGTHRDRCLWHSIMKKESNQWMINFALASTSLRNSASA